MVFSQNPEKDAFSLKKSAEKEAPRENGAPKSGVVFRRTRSLRNRSFSRHRLYDNRVASAGFDLQRKNQRIVVIHKHGALAVRPAAGQKHRRLVEPETARHGFAVLGIGDGVVGIRQRLAVDRDRPDLQPFAGGGIPVPLSLEFDPERTAVVSGEIDRAVAPLPGRKRFGTGVDGVLLLRFEPDLAGDGHSLRLARRELDPALFLQTGNVRPENRGGNRSRHQRRQKKNN